MNIFKDDFIYSENNFVNSINSFPLHIFLIICFSKIKPKINLAALLYITLLILTFNTNLIICINIILVNLGCSIILNKNNISRIV